MNKKFFALMAVAATGFVTTTAVINEITPVVRADAPGHYKPHHDGRAAKLVGEASPDAHIYIYVAPDLDADTIGYYSAGTHVTVHDSVSGWYYITSGSTRGWVPADHVEFLH